LKLNLNDLLDASTSTNILKVLGNSGDTVNTSGLTEGPKEPLSSLIVSLLIRKPPIPEAIVDKLMIVGASYADPSGKPGAGKSYIVFGKADSSAIDLSVSWLYQTQHRIYLLLICHSDRHHSHPQSNHPSHRQIQVVNQVRVNLILCLVKPTVAPLI
jgi:hypothetical protein